MGFFDHDDYCEPTMYEHLYSLAEETKADMVFSPFVAVDEYGKRIKNSSYPEGASVKDLYKTSVGLTLCDTIAYSKTSCPKTIWNKLYRNEIIQTHHIRFIDTRKAAPEDTPFNIEYMYYCKNIAITSSELYYHVFHSHNTGNSAEYKSMKKYALSLQAIHDFLSQKDEMEHEDIKERLDNTIRMNILVTFMNEVEKLGIGRAIKDCFYVNKNHPFIADAYEHTSRIMYPGGQSSKRNALSFVLSRIFK